MNSTDWIFTQTAWRLLGLRFVPLFALLNVFWEAAQLPLYSLWSEASAGEVVFAVAHCTVGDVLIGTSALMLALILTRSRAPATWNLAALIIISTFIGIAYTIFSEWMNTRWLESWTYSAWMPTLPLTGTGLTPLLQWLVLPGTGLMLALRRTRGVC